ncbi:MAG: AAA family ATPase [Dehalococcoidia bacterium]
MAGSSESSPVRLQLSSKLIGRGSALEVLSESVDRAITGDPSVVLISGEAGVGKTRLVREVAALAEARGAQVCMSRCIEGSLVPYLPFANALLPRLERAGLVQEGDVLRLLRPGARAPEETPLNDRTPELYFALPQATFELASRRPLLLVVDDVQWADASTLAVLEHLVLGAADQAADRRIPMCLVAVHRDLSPASPAGRLVARFRREHIVQSVAVAGLTELELNDLLWETAGDPPTPPLLSSLHRLTGGNPLFALETLKLLASQGALQRQGAYVATSEDLEDLAIHNEITAAIDQRVTTLPVEVADVLTVAALLGEEAPFVVLQRVTELDAMHVAELAEAAVDEGFAVQTEPGIRISHPLVRRVLARRWGRGRRQRMHLRIAEALAGTNVEMVEIQVASHLLAAGAAADPLDRATAAMAAADRAMSVRAWGEAARFYAAAYSEPAYTDSLSQVDRARLAIRTGVAQYRNLDVYNSETTFAEAVRLCREAGDYAGWADALVGWIRAQISHDNSSAARLLASVEIRDFFDDVGADHPVPRARMEAELAEVLFAVERPEAAELAQNALEGGRAAGDVFSTMHASVGLGLAFWQQLQPEAALAYYEEALKLAREYGDPWYEAWPLQRMPLALAAIGRLKEAETVADEAGRIATRTHDWAEHSLTLATLTCLATLRGDFEGTERFASEAALMYRRSNYRWAPGLTYPALAQARLLRGEWSAANHAIGLWEHTGVRGPAWLMRVLRFAQEGRLQAVRDELAAHPNWMTRPYPDSMFSLGPLAVRAEIATAVGMPELGENSREELTRALEAGTVFTLPQGVFLIPRVLADLAWARGEVDEAQDRYNLAIAVARASHARTELALALYGKAQLLASNLRGRDEVVALVMEALALFDELGMVPWVKRTQRLAKRLGLDPAPELRAEPQALSAYDREVLERFAEGLRPQEIATRLLLSERAIARRLTDLRARLGFVTPGDAEGFLSATPAPLDAWPRLETRVAGSGGLRVFLVSDIVGSTELNERLGDQQWSALLDQHNRVVREQIAAFDGAEVKHTGDGIFAVFASAASAIGCSIEVEARFPISTGGHEAVNADVCLGLSAGEPMTTGTDFYGLSVTQAFRICDRAGPSQILVSEAVHKLVDGGPFTFVDRGRFALKGFKGRARLYQVVTRSRELAAV